MGLYAGAQFVHHWIHPFTLLVSLPWPSKLGQGGPPVKGYILDWPCPSHWLKNLPLWYEWFEVEVILFLEELPAKAYQLHLPEFIIRVFFLPN